MKFSIKKSIDTLGRIVIPKNLREYYGFELGEEISLVPTDNGIVIMKRDKNKEPESQSTSEK